jgi:hypothetical protein
MWRGIELYTTAGVITMLVFVRKVVQCEITCNEKLDRNQSIMLNFRDCGFEMLPTQFLDHIDRLLEQNKGCSVIGNLNIDLYDERRISRDYINLMMAEKYTFLNSLDADSYTYYGPYGPSLIDHAWSDMVDRRYNTDLCD